MSADRNINLIIEQNIKNVLGEQQFQLIVLNTELVEAKNKIGAMEASILKKAGESSDNTASSSE